MIVIVSLFWEETTQEIQSTHAHVVFDVQNKMAPHYIFIISQLWLTSHPRSTVVLLDTETLDTSEEIYTEDADVCLLSLLILSRARNNAARIASARKQRSCRRFRRNQVWWENVRRKYCRTSAHAQIEKLNAKPQNQ